MTELVAHINPAFSSFKADKVFFCGLGLICLLVIAGLLFFGIIMQQFLIALGIIGGSILIFFCIRYPLFWIYSMVAVTFYYFEMGPVELTTIEVFEGIYFLGFLYIWFFWQIFIKKEKIIRNPADWFILFFFVALLFNFFIALFDGNDLLKWLREYVNYSGVLLYFPFRHYLVEKKHILILLTIFAFSMVISDLYQIYLFKNSSISEAIYAYQIAASFRFKQAAFAYSLILYFIVSLNVRRFWLLLGILILTCLSGTALILTYARTFWILSLLAIIVSILYLPKRMKLRSFLSLTILLTMSTISIFVLFRQNANIALQIVSNRFTSTAKGTKDKSLALRFYEYQSVITDIEKLPLGGYGLSKIHEFLDPYFLKTARTPNVHNGYLFSFYRMGIPLFLFYLFPFFYYILKGENLARKSSDPFYKSLVAISFTSLIFILGVNFMASIFIEREATFVTLLSITFINFVEKQVYSQEKIQKL